MMLDLVVAECDGCRMRLIQAEMPHGWITVDIDPESARKPELYCCTECLVATQAGLIQPHRGIHLGLSRLDLDMLDLLVRGLSNSEISIRLDQAESTTKNRFSHIFRALRVDSRLTCALAALRLGLAESSEMRVLHYG